MQGYPGAVPVTNFPGRISSDSQTRKPVLCKTGNKELMAQLLPVRIRKPVRHIPANALREYGRILPVDMNLTAPALGAMSA
jgi:hypothetical protein